MCYWQESSRKKIILGYNKNYAILTFNYVLKNLEKTISVSGIYKRDWNKNIIVKKNI